MSGYNHNEGMSNRAVSAYENGRKPLSQFKKADLTAYGHGLQDLKIGFVKWLAKNNIWQTTEWHHSGGSWYNAVDFYDLEDLVAIIQEKGLENLIEKFEASKNDAKAQKVEEIRVEGKFAIWGGSRRHPKHLGYENFTGVLVGNWILLDGGSRKKANGNHLQFKKVK